METLIQPVLDRGLYDDILGYLTFAGVILAGILLLLWLASIVTNKNLFGPMRALFIPAAWVVSLLALTGSLVYSLSYNLEPCDLCWYQRIAIYPIAIILFFGSVFKTHRATFFAGIFAAGGMVISLYHYLLQQGALSSLGIGGSGVCGLDGGCSVQYVNYNLTLFSFISIPFMAFTASTLILLFILIGSVRGEKKS